MISQDLTRMSGVYKSLRLSAIFVCMAAGINAQAPDSISAAGILSKVNAAIHAYDGCQYDATMRFQTFGSDTFEVRDFVVAFRWNEGNAIYGYDWSVSEAVDTGHFTVMVLPGSLYTVLDKAKFMGHRTLTEPLQGGDYFETLRLYFMLDEVVAPFLSKESIQMSDSSGFTVLSVQTNPAARRHLVIDRESWLPVRSISVIRDEGFGFTQTNDVEFRHSVTPGVVSDSMLSPQYYLDRGYEFNTPTEKVVQEEEEEEEEEELYIPAEHVELLLAYPFLSGEDDEVRLDSIETSFILLDFWYASCHPCLRAMPDVQRLADEMEPDLSVYAINCFDAKIRTNLTTRMRQKGITIPLLFGEKDLVRTLGFRSFPTYLLIYPDRQIRVIRGGAEEVRHIIENTPRK